MRRAVRKIRRDDLSLFEALSLYKQTITKVGKDTRNLLLQQAGHLQARDSLLCTVARMVVLNN
eukprot:9264802-Karenia_brevis.AAC.1